MQYLGDTIEKIAGEKAGIIKQEVPVVYCAERASVAQIIDEKAKEIETKSFPVSK